MRFLEIRLQDTYIRHVESTIKRKEKKEKRIQPHCETPEKFGVKIRFLASLAYGRETDFHPI